MAKNDVVFLDEVIEHRAEHGPTDDPGEFFELFTAEQILKDRASRELSYEELDLGRVGGSDDGGIDSLYVFLDGRLLEEGEEFDDLRDGVELTIHAIQSKRAGGFSEFAVQRMSDTFAHLLDLGMTREELDDLELYDSTLLDRAELARTALRAISPYRPSVRVEVAFATRGDTGALNNKVVTRAATLEEEIKSELDKPEVHIGYYGARELLALSRQTPSRELELVYHRLPQDDGGNGYVALVTLEDYHEFLAEDDGHIRDYIFEGNVRDFLRTTEVNKAIRSSLEDPSAPQFWWLNNGVTIVCKGTRIMNQRLFLEEPLVVNGLQTSLVLYDYFKTRGRVKKGQRDTRLILVRVLQTDDAKVRDAVISATNRQNPVEKASLRATEEIHRDIEQYFEGRGWFYDRRKNYWKNRGKPATHIVSITHLAQAIMAIGLQRPDEARGRPGSIFSAPDADGSENGVSTKPGDKLRYEDVFSDAVDPGVYLWAAQTLRRVERFLHKHPERLNYKFHLAMLASFEKLGKRAYSPSALRPLVGKAFTDEELRAALEKLEQAVADFRGTSETPTDRIAKNTEFVAFLLDRHFPKRKKAPVKKAGTPRKKAVKRK